MINALYIDDEIDRPGRDAQKIKELLELGGEIKVDLQPPPKNFSSLLDISPDVLLVDLDLSAFKTEDEENISYYGSTLAAEMRMHHEACPIILITRPQRVISVGGWTHSLLEKKVDVDLILYKDDINRHKDREKQRIVSLVTAFQALADTNAAKWENIVGLIGANEDEAGELREAAPPMEKGVGSIPQIVRWLRTVLIAYPGILYDELTAATRLGISVDSFKRDEVQEIFSEASYQGLLDDYEQRWWKRRLFRIAHELISKTDLSGPISLSFREAFAALREVELDPAICVYDKTTTADWVCYVLKEPVKQKNSLPYYPDSRPPIMDQARVSYKAILESNEFDETLVDADSLPIVDELWG